DLSLFQTVGISVVGTRNPSPRGISLTKEVVSSIGQYGFTTISGLAMGIDGYAHIQALSKEFKTIGVIATPICDCYPPKHLKLQSLVAQYGLLVSQFAPSRKVQKYFFMERNLLMSKISKGSFVIEDRDGGGGTKQALYSERDNKPVFILRETYENRTYLWPRKYKDPVIIGSADKSGALIKRSLQLNRAFGKKAKEENTQLSLF
ncbi:MAG: DNA-processing protein DprA, partial [Sphaerochaetaceae bacterium]|nr:DNA-processing protein DprA [Sphaerochaetaceae bacterium]